MDSDPRDMKPVDSAIEIDGQPDFISIFAELIRNREDWLMDRILSYAKRQGYARYTSTLKEAWRLSISGLSTSMLETLDNLSDLELGPDEDFSGDPAAAFGLIEAKRHRKRGVSLPMFLGLMKYYRQSYQDLVEASELPAAARSRARVWVDRFFDRVEIAFCNAWTAATDEDGRLEELQRANRSITNEKNKYLTVFESIATVVLFEDLTERKGIADELARKEQFLKGVLDAIQDGISVLDVDLNIIRVNEAMKGIYTAEASLEGKKCFEAYFGRSQPCDKCPTLRTLKSGRLESEEIVLHRKNKPPVFLEVFAFPMLDDDGRLTGAVDYVRNVTERKILEEERLQREKLEAVLEIAGAVCHELNQPLMALSGYHELIRFNLDEQSPANKYLFKAHKQTRRMGDITGRLMCITRYETRDYAGGMKILDIEKSAGNPGSGSDSDD